MDLDGSGGIRASKCTGVRCLCSSQAPSLRGWVGGEERAGAGRRKGREHEVGERDRGKWETGTGEAAGAPPPRPARPVVLFRGAACLPPPACARRANCRPAPAMGGAGPRASARRRAAGSGGARRTAFWVR